MIKYFKIQSVLKIAFTLITGFAFIACDGNIPRPEDLIPNTSLSVAKFTVNETQFTSGDPPVVLTWDIEDKDGILDYVTITPDVGVVASQGSATVSPSRTTVYVIEAYAQGISQSVTERQLQVAVLDPSGNEVTELPEDEICDDGKDNDSNGATDCDDDVCAEDESCVEPPIDYTLNYTVMPEAPALGDEITISWESECDFVTISEDVGPYYGGSDSFSFMAEVDENELDEDAESYTFTYTLNCFDITGKFDDSYEVNIDVAIVKVENPEFPHDDVTIEFYATTSLNSRCEEGEICDAIYGEEYTITWKVESTSEIEVEMDGISRNDSAFTGVAGVDGPTHTLTITADNGEQEIVSIEMNTLVFESLDTAVFSSAIDEIVLGDEEGEFYFILNDAVYYNNDYLETEPLEIILSSDVNDQEINSFAVKGNTYFIGTDLGIYTKDKDDAESEPKQVIGTLGWEKCISLVVTEEKILYGLDGDEGVFEVYANENDDDGYSSRKIYMDGYSFLTASLFLRNPSDKKQIFVITDEGVFYSSDSGVIYSRERRSTMNIIGGSWSFGSVALVWSNNEVYKWDGEGFKDSETAALTSTKNINYVIFQNGHYYVATDEGVDAYSPSSGHGVFNAGLETSIVKYLIADTSVASTDFKIIAITDDGKKHILDSLSPETEDEGGDSEE